MAGKPRMVLPPVGDSGVDREHADLADVRVPAAFGRWDDERWPRPVGYYDGRLARGATATHVPGPCNPSGGWSSNRHLFDALIAEEGDVYVGDDLTPSPFRLVLTCVRCGLVKELRGHLDPAGEGERTRSFLDPVPLQAGELLAQEISRSHVWGDEWNVEWTIYRDGQRVGWMATQRGQRGRRYVAGGLGRRYRDEHEVLQAPSAIAVLRKLAKLAAAVPA